MSQFAISRFIQRYTNYFLRLVHGENMEQDTKIMPTTKVESRIFTLRNQQVMIDRDLAELYGVETKVLNQAIKRNKERFPEEFCFQLNSIETSELVTNC